MPQPKGCIPFFHKPNYEAERSKRFARYGYRTLFLNDNDLELSAWEDICLAKISDFIAKDLVFCVGVNNA